MTATLFPNEFFSKAWETQFYWMGKKTNNPPTEQQQKAPLQSINDPDATFTSLIDYDWLYPLYFSLCSWTAFFSYLCSSISSHLCSLLSIRFCSAFHFAKVLVWIDFDLFPVEHKADLI